MASTTRKIKYILPAIIVMVIIVLFVFIMFGYNYDMGKNGLYDEQIKISLLPDNDGVYTGSFISTKSSDRFHSMAYFSFTEKYTEKNADEDKIYRKLSTIINSIQFHIQDEKGTYIDMRRMTDSVAVVVDNGIAIAVAEHIELESGKKYFVEVKIKNEIEKYHFLNPVIYVFRKPPPSL